MKEGSLAPAAHKAVFSYNRDILIALIALSAAGIHLNGIYALWQLLICSATAVVSEYFSFKHIVKKTSLDDLSALTTGITIALLLPVSAPFYVGISACLFAILAAKLPFGDVRCTPFVPAAAGFCFAAMMFPGEVFTYPDTDSAFAFFSQQAFVKGETLFDMLSKGDSLSLNVFGRISLLSGDYPGAIGTTGILTLIGAFAFLAVTHPRRIICSVGYLLSAGLMALAFPRVNSGRLSSVVIELCAGSLIFTALLLINDPVTSPAGRLKAFLYGCLAGVICMLLRYYSKTPDPACFSVLITNAVYPLISSLTFKNKKARTRRAKEK